MYKKIIVSLLCAAMLCSCAAKDKSNDKTAEKSTTSSMSDSTTNNIVIPSESPDDSTTNVADTTVEATGIAANDYSTQKVIWGPGNTVNHQRPNDPVSLQNQYGKLGAKFILDDKKIMCLTFDEGYENGYTPSILDTLKEKKVKAVFFVTYDFAKDNPQLIKRMIDEGHTVGNHTYRHYTMDEVSTEAATEEIVFLDKYIKKNYNYQMKYFRFPKGEFSQSTLALANSLGYKSIFWSFAYADWDTDNVADTADALKNITSSTHNGAIFLLHAVSPTNAKILGDAIDNIKEQGYTFTTNI